MIGGAFWFPVVGGGLMLDMAACSPAAVGAWLRLKVYLLAHPALPKAMDDLVRITGASPKDIKAALVFFDKTENGIYYSKEIEDIKWKITQTQERRKEAGMKGAETRWGKR